MSVESRVQQELDEKNAALAEKVESAKLEQLQGQFAQDLDTLKKRIPTPESEALEAAKDKLFLRERQRTDCAVFVQVDCPVTYRFCVVPTFIFKPSASLKPAIH